LQVCPQHNEETIVAFIMVILRPWKRKYHCWPGVASSREPHQNGVGIKSELWNSWLQQWGCLGGNLRANLAPQSWSNHLACNNLNSYSISEFLMTPWAMMAKHLPCIPTSANMNMRSYVDVRWLP
jgi:hypothetical protein